MIRALLLTLILAGCATEYPCGEPSTGSCKSVAAHDELSYSNYTNADDVEASFFGSSPSAAKLSFSQYPQIPVDGAPLLSPAKMLRVWLTPYTDADNIYHDQSYEYMIVKTSEWRYGKAPNPAITIKDVVAAQVGTAKGGYGAYGLAEQAPQQKPALSFPALKALSGVDRTTLVSP